MKLTRKQVMTLSDIVGAIACAKSYVDHPKDERDISRASLHLDDAMTKLRCFINIEGQREAKYTESAA